MAFAGNITEEYKTDNNTVFIMCKYTVDNAESGNIGSFLEFPREDTVVSIGTVVRCPLLNTDDEAEN